MNLNDYANIFKSPNLREYIHTNNISRVMQTNVIIISSENLISQCFQGSSAAEASEGVCMWEIVNDAL